MGSVMKYLENGFKFILNNCLFVLVVLMVNSVK